MPVYYIRKIMFYGAIDMTAQTTRAKIAIGYRIGHLRVEEATSQHKKGLVGVPAGARLEGCHLPANRREEMRLPRLRGESGAGAALSASVWPGPFSEVCGLKQEKAVRKTLPTCVGFI